MTLQALMRALDDVLVHLPFSLDDYDEANAAFAAAYAPPADPSPADPVAARTVELWTYCYVRRYYLFKFLREESLPVTDVEELISKAFLRARTNYDRVQDARRFTAWVSRICLNTFINYLRSTGRHTTELEEEAHLEPTSPEAGRLHDRTVVRHCFEQAIQRLPASLQNVARMRLLERQSYQAIGEATGRPVPSVRSYVNKSLNRLREDPVLRALWNEMDGEAAS
jgi:RNA polymerase sigma factor (sigma-70 family)